MLKNGSVAKSVLGALVKGSSRAAGFPRCDSTNRSPFETRRNTPAAFFRNSSIVTVFIHREV
jgi:hypothetical protein